jgi:large subunit ribosomal protein L24
MGSTSDAFSIDNLPTFAKAKVNLGGRLDADDGTMLIDLLGLDRFIAADKRPGRLTVTAKGSLDGELAIDGQLGVGALNVVTKGTIRVPIRTDANAGPGAALDLKVVNANVRSLRPAAAGRVGDLLPVSGSARLALAEGTLRLMNVTGTVAGTNVGGSLVIGLQRQPMTIDGNVELGAIDLPGTIAAALRVPASTGGTSTNAAASWPADPFEPDPLRLEGQVAFKSARVALTPKLAARDVRGLLHFGGSELALESLDGSIAGGRVAGELTFIRGAEGVSARGHVRFAGANAAELLPGDGALSGRLTLDLTAEGTGMSSVALVGSLDGGGTFTLENGRLARLDPAAFDAVIRAVDQGLPIDAIRVRDRMDAALANSGGLAVALAEGAIVINAGQARLGSTMVRAQNADLTVNGSISLTAATLDGRLILSGMPGPGAPVNTRPEIFIALKGPADAPKRSIDAGAFASWLALRAVEQQSKKLDVLEGREAPPTPAAPAAAAATQTTPVRTAPARDAVAPPAVNAKADDPKDTGAADAKAADSAVPVVPAERPRPRPASAPVYRSKPIAPSAEQVQPLPPPIDVRPAPAPRAPRTQPGMGAARQPPPRPLTPPAPRSLSEILFGN